MYMSGTVLERWGLVKNRLSSDHESIQSIDMRVIIKT